jgi:DNA repair exonuclease SbcCD ATPase subunit
MLRGNKVLEEIDSKIHGLKRDARAYGNTLEDHENKIHELSNERENIYTSLAITYLPFLNDASIAKTIHDVHDNVAKIFEQKKKRRNLLEEKIQEEETKIEELGSILDTVSENLETISQKRDRIMSDVHSELQNNNTYVGYIALRDERLEQISENEKALHQMRQLSDKLIPAYELNKLFNYLLSRDFGLPAYENPPKMRIIKHLDRWIAGLVDFRSQKKHYDFLRSMPELMGNELNERKTFVSDIEESLHALEHEVASKYDLLQITEELKEATEKKKQMIKEVEAAYKRRHEYASERKTLDNEKGDYHRKAISEIKEFLKGNKISHLKRLAQETHAPEDDQMVYNLERIDKEIRHYKDRSKSCRNERDAIEEKLSGLRNLKRKFRSHDYESSRSQFNNGFDINGLLTGYMLGRISDGQLWNTIDSYQSFERPSYTTFSSGSSVSTYDSGSSSWDSGGFSTGGFSDGGGFSGGGFSDGGGF